MIYADVTQFHYQLICALNLTLEVLVVPGAHIHLYLLEMNLDSYLINTK